MTLRAIEPEQHIAAKAAGSLYLFTMATAIFAEFYVRARQIVPGDAAQTARNIAAHERLFRLGTVSDLVTFAGCVVLIVALYVILKPIDENVAEHWPLGGSAPRCWRRSSRWPSWCSRA